MRVYMLTLLVVATLLAASGAQAADLTDLGGHAADNFLRVLWKVVRVLK